MADYTAEFVRAKDVLPADGTRRVVLYLHGGGFLTGGANTHARLVTMISRSADAPMLVNYRMMPKHSLGQAIDDYHDAYYRLRELGHGAGTDRARRRFGGRLPRLGAGRAAAGQ